MRAMRHIGSWTLSLFLAAVFLWLADQTLFPVRLEGDVVFTALAAASGVAFWEPTGRVAVAGIEVIAAILLLLPPSRSWGAWLALLVSAGAALAHLLWLGFEIPLGEDPVRTDGGGLLGLLLAILAASGGLTILTTVRSSR